MPHQSGAKAIVAYQGKMLLILRDNKPTIPFPDMWNAPGRGIEPGETPEDAVRRELKEEISISPKLLIAGETTFYEHAPITYRFFSRVTSEEYLQIKLGDEGQRLDWFTLEEAFALSISPNFRLYLEQKKEIIENFLKESQEV